MLTWIVVLSSLCHHSVRRARPRPRFDTQGPHRVLQYRTGVRSQSYLAVYIEGHHPVSQEDCGMLCHECPWYDCKRLCYCGPALRI